MAFESGAGNVVPGDTNGFHDVFVHDRVAGTARRVSVKADGFQAKRGGGLPAISADEHVVGFASDGANLVPGDTNGRSDVFVGVR